jgi:hypothetical protein
MKHDASLGAVNVKLAPQRRHRATPTVWRLAELPIGECDRFPAHR